ncbi:pirin family protein [Arachidicoccus terrestris]|uniref:pirin family protein n=1 Tax=Arachidicoccus terrestris TaxID=2875539 RepID=UPI001CC6F55C|nr:pirin family protein [Arachidicoccus terrestris]UAY56129.1 pirin family protein [Arachidicoccus terrestris]
MEKKIDRVIAKPARAGMVGDGFRVFNFIPQAVGQKRISPFLMLDFNAAYDFGPSDHIRGVDVHPHKGFETVTIAYQGSVAHHDSAGNSGVINPGDVQWMTAGNGILHKEYHEENFSKKGGNFEMVQLWVNLPKKDKSVAAHYQPLTKNDIPVVTLPDGKSVVRVIAGEFQEQKGAASTYTSVNLLDVHLEAGGEVTIPVPTAHNTALLFVNGGGKVNGRDVQEHDFVLFENDGEDIHLQASEKAVILLMSGTPIDEPIASYGPFVMNTQDEIIEAINDFNQGKFGHLE